MSLNTLKQYLGNRINGAELVCTKLNLCPQILLYLINEDYPQHQLTAQQASELMDEPPYWAFCWASGQVLAKYIIDNPHLVVGKTVVDFGAGSGVVAIASKMAGADRVIACDQDMLALQACQLNAELNNVEIELCENMESINGGEFIAISDVFYDRENLPLLEIFQSHFDQVLVADSRLKGRALPDMKIIDTFTSHTVPDLNESADFNSVCLYLHNILV